MESDPLVEEEAGVLSPPSKKCSSKLIGVIVGGVAIVAVVVAVAVVSATQTTSNASQQIAQPSSHDKSSQDVPKGKDESPALITTTLTTTPLPTLPSNKDVEVGPLRQSKIYKVNLDDEPENRWKEVAEEYKDVIQELSDVVGEEQMFKSLMPSLTEKINNAISQPYLRELQGIANVTDLSIADVALTNLFYEIAAGHSTSLVVQGQDGYIWHARSITHKYTDLLKDSTIQVEFFKNNQLLYRASTWAGFIGVLTGEKPNVVSITVDRNVGNKDISVAVQDPNSVLVSLQVREILEEASRVSTTVRKLSRLLPQAPVSFMVAGVGEASLLSGATTLSLQPKNGVWYLIGNNYEDPSHSDALVRYLNVTGPNDVTATSMLQMLIPPDVSDSDTVYSTVMSPAQSDVYYTMVWPI